MTERYSAGWSDARSLFAPGEWKVVDGVAGFITPLGELITRDLKPRGIEQHSCRYCTTVMEWRSVDPGPSKCPSCGAPRTL